VASLVEQTTNGIVVMALKKMPDRLADAALRCDLLLACRKRL
jgi:hypothetical protein